MKILCKYTGTALVSEGWFPDNNKFNLAATHPLFLASNEILLSNTMLKSWYDGTMGSTPKKLLFLALANNNGMIKWNEGVIAMPTSKVVETCMPLLLSTLSWLADKQRGRKVEIPIYSISLENQTMHNFKQYLQEVNSARYTSIANEDKEEHDRVWEASINKLVKNMNAGMIGADKALNIAMAKWACSVANVPAEKQELWKKLLSATDKQLITYSSSDMQELHDYMEWELPVGTVAAHTVMTRCRDMLDVSTNLLGKLDTSFMILGDAFNSVPSPSTNKVQVGAKTYSPRVMELLKKHAEQKEKFLANANKPVVSALDSNINNGRNEGELA